MFAQLTAGLDFQATALSLRAERQRVIASNIANSDTPGYAARDINFKDAMAAATGLGGPTIALATSRAPPAQRAARRPAWATPCRPSPPWTTTRSIWIANAPILSTTPCDTNPPCDSLTAIPRRS